MAIDLVHTGELIDHLLTLLRAHLPANWFVDGIDGDETPLRLLEHGDLADWARDASRDLSTDLPAIVVSGAGPENVGPGGTSGILDTEEQLRIVHVRRFDECYTSDGARERNMVRARARYAKIIGQAVLRDTKARLAYFTTEGSTETRHDVALTCTDAAGAQVYGVRFVSWDLGGSEARTPDVMGVTKLGLPMWAIALDIAVKVRVGG